MADPTKLQWLNEEDDNQLGTKIETRLNTTLDGVDAAKIQAVVDILKNPDGSFLDAYKKILRTSLEKLETSNPTQIAEARKLLDKKVREKVLKAVNAQRDKIEERIEALGESVEAKSNELTALYTQKIPEKLKTAEDRLRNPPSQGRDRGRGKGNRDGRDTGPVRALTPVEIQGLEELRTQLEEEVHTRVKIETASFKAGNDAIITALENLLDVVDQEKVKAAANDQTAAEQARVAAEAAAAGTLTAEQAKEKELREDYKKIATAKDFKILYDIWNSVSASEHFHNPPTGGATQIYLPKKQGSSERVLLDDAQMTQWQEFMKLVEEMGEAAKQLQQDADMAAQELIDTPPSPDQVANEINKKANNITVKFFPNGMPAYSRECFLFLMKTPDVPEVYKRITVYIGKKTESLLKEKAREAEANVPLIPSLADVDRVEDLRELQFICDQVVTADSNRVPKPRDRKLFSLRDKSPLTQEETDRYHEFQNFMKIDGPKALTSIQEKLQVAMATIGAQVPTATEDFIEDQAEEVTRKLIDEQGGVPEEMLLYYTLGVENEAQAYEKLEDILKRQLESLKNKGQLGFDVVQGADGQKSTVKLSVYLETNGQEIVGKTQNLLERLHQIYGSQLKTPPPSPGEFRDVLIEVIKSRGGKDLTAGALKVSQANAQMIYGAFLTLKEDELPEDAALALLMAYKDASPAFLKESMIYNELHQKLGMDDAEFKEFILRVVPHARAVMNLFHQAAATPRTAGVPEAVHQEAANQALKTGIVALGLVEEDIKRFNALMSIPRAVDKIGPAFQHAKSNEDLDVPVIEERLAMEEKVEEKKVKLDVVMVNVEEKFRVLAERRARARYHEEVAALGPKGWFDFKGYLGIVKKVWLRNAEEGYIQKYKEEFMVSLKEPGFRAQAEKELASITERVGVGFNAKDRTSYLTEEENKFEEQQGVQQKMKDLCAAFLAESDDATATVTFKTGMQAIIDEVKNSKQTTEEITAFLEDSDTSKNAIDKMGLLDKLRAHKAKLMTLDLDNLKVHLGTARNVDVQTNIQAKSRFDRAAAWLVGGAQKNQFLQKFITPATVGILGYAAANLIGSLGTKKLAMRSFGFLAATTFAPLSAPVLALAAGCLAGGTFAALRENREIQSLKQQAEVADTLGTAVSGGDRTAFEKELIPILYAKKPAKVLVDAINTAGSEGALREALAEAIARYEISATRGKKEGEDKVNLIQYGEQTREQQIFELAKTIEKGKSALIAKVQSAHADKTANVILAELAGSVTNSKTKLLGEIEKSEAGFKDLKRKEVIKAGIVAGVVGGVASGVLSNALHWAGLHPGHFDSSDISGAEDVSDAPPVTDSRTVLFPPLVGNRKKHLGQGKKLAPKGLFVKLKDYIKSKRNPPPAPPGAPPPAPPGAPPPAPPGAPPPAPPGAPSSAPSGAPSSAPSGTPPPPPSGAPSSAPSGAPSSAPSGTPPPPPSGTPSSAPSGAPAGRPAPGATPSVASVLGSTTFVSPASGFVGVNAAPAFSGLSTIAAVRGSAPDASASIDPLRGIDIPEENIVGLLADHALAYPPDMIDPRFHQSLAHRSEEFINGPVEDTYIDIGPAARLALLEKFWKFMEREGFRRDEEAVLAPYKAQMPHQLDLGTFVAIINGEHLTISEGDRSIIAQFYHHEKDFFARFENPPVLDANGKKSIYLEIWRALALAQQVPVEDELKDVDIEILDEQIANLLRHNSFNPDLEIQGETVTALTSSHIHSDSFIGLGPYGKFYLLGKFLHFTTRSPDVALDADVAQDVETKLSVNPGKAQIIAQFYQENKGIFESLHVSEALLIYKEIEEMFQYAEMISGLPVGSAPSGTEVANDTQPTNGPDAQKEALSKEMADFLIDNGFERGVVASNERDIDEYLQDKTFLDIKSSAKFNLFKRFFRFYAQNQPTQGKEIDKDTDLKVYKDEMTDFLQGQDQKDLYVIAKFYNENLKFFGKAAIRKQQTGKGKLKAFNEIFEMVRLLRKLKAE